MIEPLEPTSANRALSGLTGRTDGETQTLRLRELRARFDRAATTAGATRPTDAAFQGLVARYSEPHRRYHTLAHIDACLAWLDWFSGCSERAEEVELALWFHDAVYSLGGDDNERRSAELARAQLGALGVGGAAIDRIARHIETTEKHTAAGGDSALSMSALTCLRSSVQRSRMRDDVHRKLTETRPSTLRVLLGVLDELSS